MPLTRLMGRFYLLVVFCMILSLIGRGQSFEVMPGTQRIFVDVQWLKPFNTDDKWTLFSRARATAEYDANRTDLFLGGYLNYTTSSGFGGTVVGRVASLGAGMDVGVHYFKNGGKFIIYALPSIQIQKELSYSWFSIMRYTPPLGETLKLYTSLELFSNFNGDGHVVSVQRIRAGVALKKWQFGLALNLTGLGSNYRNVDTNPGVFLREQF